MRVASFFAGIGGFDLGFQQAGHTVAFHCEIDEFCNQILARHWPNTPQVRDIKEIADGNEVPAAEIWCGGFPCQDVSVARGGHRPGLRGHRTGLFYDFARLVGDALPPVVVLENVPGLLSSHGGSDFGIVLKTLGDLGYAVGWRMLDSRYFGVPQSRRRLYVVGYHRDPARAEQVLLEPECGHGDTPASKRAGASAVSPFKESLGNPLTGPVVQRIGYCLAATSGRHTGTDWSRTYVSYPDAVRRLTPTEAERLQGFPDGWTIPSGVRDEELEQMDSPRYFALGNAVSVPVAQWIAERILAAGLEGVVAEAPAGRSVAAVG